jgi:hypothetical protein
LVNIKHEFSLKRPEFLPRLLPQAGGLAIGMNFQIGSAGQKTRAGALKRFHDQ